LAEGYRGRVVGGLRDVLIYKEAPLCLKKLAD
jgi:hypothetical protein